MIKKYLVIVFAAFSFAYACVPARLVDESKAKQKECETELASVKKSAQECDSKLAELKEQMVKNEKENVGLKRCCTYCTIVDVFYKHCISSGC